MGRDRLRQRLFERVRRASHADLSGLTVVRARSFLARFPDFGPVWHSLSIALMELARYDEAFEALSKAIDLCPVDKLRIPYASMGHLHDLRGDREQAAVWYRRSIEAAPHDASGYIYLGILMEKQGRFSEAAELHRAGTQCQEGCIDEAFLNLGLVLRAFERFEEAADCFREAIRLDPEYRAAKRALRDVKACLRERERLR